MARLRISVTLPKPCLDWFDGKVKDRTYANRSHAIEVLILEKMKKMVRNVH